jgi:hypothetical protein
VLSRDKIRAMEDQADSERDKLIVRILGDTGIRLREPIKLTLGYLRIDGHESLTMINQVYANLTMDDAHDALLRSLLVEQER